TSLRPANCFWKAAFTSLGGANSKRRSYSVSVSGFCLFHHLASELIAAHMAKSRPLRGGRFQSAPTFRSFAVPRHDAPSAGFKPKLARYSNGGFSLPNGTYF